MSDDIPTLTSVAKIEDAEAKLINGDDWRKYAREKYPDLTDEQDLPVRVLCKLNATDLDEKLADLQEAHDQRKLNNMIDNTNYQRIPKMRNFDSDRLKTVEYLAKALDEQEILDYFGITEELRSWERYFFKRAYNKGVSMGKREAMEKLFASMNDRTGGMHALKYLQTHAAKFPSDGGDPISAKSSGGFSFSVDLT